MMLISKRGPLKNGSVITGVFRRSGVYLINEIFCRYPGPRFIPEKGVFGLITPLYHIISSAISGNCCWCQGNTVIFFPTYDFPKMLEGIQKYKV